MSQVIIISGGFVGLLLAIVLLVLLHKKEKRYNGLLILEYDYKTTGKKSWKIGLNFKKKKMKVYYDNDYNTYKLPKRLNKQINKIFNDYHVLNLEKSELLLDDDENSSIYYEMWDGRKKIISKEEYADCNENVFREIKNVLEKCLP